MQTIQDALQTTHKRGRPTKYVSEPFVLLGAYLEGCKDIFEVATRRWHVRLPTVEGFAAYLGVHRDTLYTWTKRHPEYRDALDKLMSIQFVRLINGGLAGHYNPTITILLLKRNHWKRLTRF